MPAQRSGSSISAQHLADLLDAHRGEIVSAWHDAILAVPDSGYRRLDGEALRDSISRLLDAVVERLSTGSQAALTGYSQTLSAARVRQGFDIAEVVQAILLGEEAAMAVLDAAEPDLAPDRLLAFERELDACLHAAVCAFSGSFAAEAGRLLRAQQARTALILELLKTAGGTLDLDEVLRRVADGIAAAANVRYCNFYLLDERGLLVPHSGTRAVPSQAAHQYFIGWTIDPATNDFTREVLERRQPAACYDLAADPRINQEATRAMGVKSVLAVPFVVKDRAVGLAIASTYDVHREFTSDEIDLAWGIANAVALAVDNARLHQEVRSLAVLQERERLAREMHDRLAQTLAYLNVKAAVVEAMLANGQDDRARSSLAEVKEVVKEAYTDVRGTIYDLRLAAQPGQGLIPTLRACLAHAQKRYGLPASLDAEAPDLPELTTEVELQVVRIVQEALANAGQHAQAGRAWVRLAADGGTLVVSIEDDGRGFDPAVERPGSLSAGLQVMRERAEAAGGTLEIGSQPGRGTRVVVRVPLPSTEEVS